LIVYNFKCILYFITFQKSALRVWYHLALGARIRCSVWDSMTTFLLI
jgi:hypothetical protein